VEFTKARSREYSKLGLGVFDVFCLFDCFFLCLFLFSFICFLFFVCLFVFCFFIYLVLVDH
jgi:hypothetical protein